MVRTLVDTTELLPIPPHILSLATGLSERMGCSVIVKRLAKIDSGQHRLTLEVSAGCTTHPKSQAMINSLKAGSIVLKRNNKNLSVVKGDQKFTRDCPANVASVLKGLARDYQLELVLVAGSVSNTKAIEATGGKPKRRLAD